MKYSFSIKKNIHMYNHCITCSYGADKYTAICESAPAKKETIIFWPDDFGLSATQTEDLIIDLQKWAKRQGFKCIINRGKRC